MKPSLTLLALALAAMPAAGQCSNGQCAPASFGGRYVYPSAPPAESLMHGWYQAADGLLAYYWKGERAGTLDPIEARWQSAGKAHTVDLIQTFGLARQKPGQRGSPIAFAVPPECVCDRCGCEDCPRECLAATFVSKPGDDPFPGGVDSKRVSESMTWECSGRPCSKQHVFTRLADTLSDDRAKPFLTLVADEATRKRFLADLDGPTMAALKAKCHVNVYDPSDWHVAQVGLQPGLTCQGPPDAAGKSPVLFRFRAYAGPEATAEAVRKVDPNYKPDADPDPAKPSPKPAPANPDGPDASPSKPGGSCNHYFGLTLLAACGAIGLGLGILLTRRK